LQRNIIELLRIFISHSHKDKPLIEPITTKLEKVFGRDSIFYDSWSTQPTDSGIIDKINKALTEANIFFYFVSKNSLESKMVDMEWQNAFLLEIKGGMKFVAVKLDDCVMPAVLTQKLYIDYNRKGPQIVLKEMIDVIYERNTFLAYNDAGLKEYGEDKEYAFELESTKRVIEFRGYDVTRTFVGNVWNLGIRNGLSHSVYDCKAEARIFQNETEIQHKFSLPWMSSQNLPITCHDASNNEGEFPSSYIGELFGVVIWSRTILPASPAKLLMFFTYYESDSIYLVGTPLNDEVVHDEFLSTALSIPFASLNQYKFLIKFSAEKYSRPEEIFRLEANSWNDVKLVKVG
jgi:hypothetical protein